MQLDLKMQMGVWVFFKSATHNIMCGGDQLTATSALLAKSNCDTRIEDRWNNSSHRRLACQNDPIRCKIVIYT